MNLLPNVANYKKSIFLNTSFSRYFFILFSLIILITAKGYSQPFVDIISFNYQTFSAPYDSIQAKNKTNDHFFNLFIPKQYKNSNVLIAGFNYEMINSTIISDSSYSSKLYLLALPIGFRFASKDKKSNTAVMTFQKLASDFKDKIDGKDYIFSAAVLHTRFKKDNLSFKFGMYYSREFWGNLIVPLFGVDWRPTERLYLYGVLPSFYRIEYNAIKKKLYTGVGIRFASRSFRLSSAQDNDYVRYGEIQTKFFVDYCLYKYVLLFAELGYSIGTNPVQYKYQSPSQYTFSSSDDVPHTINNPVYSPLKNYPLINVGIAFRVRMDMEKKE